MFMTRISKGSHLQYHGIHMVFFPLPTSLILHLIGPTRVWREPELLRRRWLSNQPAAVLGCDRATTPGFHERLETPNMMVALDSTGDETAWKNMAMFWYLFVKFLGLLCLSPRPFTWPIPGCPTHFEIEWLTNTYGRHVLPLFTFHTISYHFTQ